MEIMAFIASFYPFLTAEWTGDQLSWFLMFTFAPLKIRESKMYVQESWFFEKIFMIR